MKNTEKSDAAEDDSSSFDPLPDDVVLQIFRKIIDYETLCPCRLVSKRFNRITLQVDTIRFITKITSYKSFLSKIQSLKKFEGLKYLSVHIPSTSEHPCMCRWKIKCGKNLDSVIFLSPNSVYHSKKYVNENGHEEEDMELTLLKKFTAMECMDHAVLSHLMLLTCIKHIPLLEKVTLKDSGKTYSISLNAEKIAEMRSSLTSPYELIRQNRMSKCYVPLLELPVSGYVLKGVTVFLMEREDLPIGNDSFMKIDDDDSEDKLEAAFNEALMEIFKKHAARFERQLAFTSVIFV
ncbi:F-box domain, Leucine-rich repeat domain, L domain-like protein [Artemisia annua]|uniref:F-box domain, Leucine-rich repeat domain, L domain-like protein n=1 Tax=Artemisia annua TaxID=35608 RepID=A0A2U1KLC1_ARTAN|nr:F-box domain, Leucine-rich repeat domain, L domain-like protein [Artemisia annua]